MSELQLSAGKQTSFMKRNEKNKNVTKESKKFERKYYSIENIAKNHNIEIPFNEIDTAGLIFEIEPTNEDFEMLPAHKKTFQNVYVTDTHSNFICVNFWGGLSKYGLDKTLLPGNLFVFSNLQKRTGNTKKNIAEFRATELSTFNKHSSNSIYSSIFAILKNSFNDVCINDFCNQCIALRKKTTNHSKFSPYNTLNDSHNRFKTFLESNCNEIKQTNKASLDEYNLSLRDFESSFKASQENLENIKNSKIKAKISKLLTYGAPPPLMHIPILNKSKNAELAYKSPVLNENNIRIYSTSGKEATSENIVEELHGNYKTPISSISNAENCPTSPLLSSNTPRIKRKRLDVASVKLNFDKLRTDNSDKQIIKIHKDGFTEDFEFSPPLSLD